jgi:hypothetical protein
MKSQLLSQVNKFKLLAEVLSSLPNEGTEIKGTKGAWNDGKRPPERLRRRWKDNIKMHFKYTECSCMDENRLAQERVQ